MPCVDDLVGSVTSRITGQTRKMVEHYSLMVNQRRLAREAILKWEKDGK